MPFMLVRADVNFGRVGAVDCAFFIFIFKKTKFQKYMPNRKIFKNGCLSPPGGVPIAHPVGDMT